MSDLAVQGLHSDLTNIVDGEWVLASDTRKILDNGFHVFHLNPGLFQVNTLTSNTDYRTRDRVFKRFKEATLDILNNRSDNFAVKINPNNSTRDIMYYVQQYSSTIPLFYYEVGDDLIVISNNYRRLKDLVHKISRHKSIVKSNVAGIQEGRRNIDIGHVASEDSSSPLSQAIELIQSAAITKGAPLAPLEKMMRDLRSTHARYNLTVEKRASIREIFGEVKFTYTIPQHFVTNQQKIGNVEKRISARLIKYIQDQQLTASIPLPKLVDTIIESIFTRVRKIKEYRRRVAKKKDTKPKIGPLNKHGIRTKQGKFADLLGLQSIINRLLPGAIKDNMGNGNEPEVLNWQTGRFGNSAKVTNITSSDNAIRVEYSYMRYPYDVFLFPQGRLSKPGRDPRRIIDLSIRDIAINVLHSKVKIYSELK